MKLYSNLNAQRGTGLIEVLVSMLILLVGILGVAGLQTRGLNNNKSSYLRTQAAIFAEDIFDRMRANRDAASLGSYDVSDSSSIDADTQACMSTSACSATALATADLQNWFGTVKSTLPLASFTISRANSNTQLVLMWDDDKKGSIGTNCGVNVTCMTFTSRM